MNINISIDDGSAFLKATYPHKGKIKCLTLTPTRVKRGLFPSMEFDGKPVFSYEVDGKPYTVTKDSTDVIPTNNDFYQYEEVSLVMVHHALKLIQAEIGAITTATLVVTLPPRDFYLEPGIPNQANIDKKVNNLKRSITYLDGTKTIKIKEVFVLAEGIPAYLHAQSELQLPPARTLVADVGGTTLDIVIINADYMIEFATSLNLGAIKMMKELGTKVSAKLGYGAGQWTDDLLLNIILTKQHYNTDLSDVVNLVLEEFKQAVTDQLRNHGDPRNFAGGWIITGGTSQLLAFDDENIYQTQEPQFDNAKGALSVLEPKQEKQGA